VNHVRTNDLIITAALLMFPRVYSSRREERAEGLLDAYARSSDLHALPAEAQLAVSHIAHRHLLAHGGRYDARHPISQLANRYFRPEDPA
jgi:hypothetical protein